MNIDENFVYDLQANTLLIPSNFRLIFLCGVVYRRTHKVKDKRRILREYLKNNSQNYPLILEDNFSIASYNNIDLKNLHDVEMLVALFADTIIIIHESIATGAELGMFASNPTAANKILVLYPDIDSVEEDKINTFIKEAFYGLDPILSVDKNLAMFRPVIRKSHESNDRYTYHTFFPNDLTQKSTLRDKIDDFVDSPENQPTNQLIFTKTKFRKLDRDNAVVDYSIENDTLWVSLSPSALRSLMLSILTLKYLRDRIEAQVSLSDVISVLQEELNKTLLNTFRVKLGVDKKFIKIHIKGLENSMFRASSQEGYRKAVGLFVYLLKGMNILDSLKLDSSETFKFTLQFPAIRDLFVGTVSIERATAFSNIGSDLQND